MPSIPDYELLRPIGRGGYGEVWVARALTGEYRALKIVRREHFDEDRQYEREFRGIQAYSPHSRSHPGLIPIYHVGRDEKNGYFYYVMELADDLTGDHAPAEPGYTPHTLANAKAAEHPQPINTTLATGEILATALAHLHEAGLIHRDLKPANIVFLNGQPRLADPGLVTRVDAATSLVGTLGYLPPEGTGHPSADCFTLGKLLYELNTGLNHAAFPRLPAAARTAEWPREARRLNQVITTACAIDPAHRYETAHHLAEDLRRVNTHRPLQATRKRRRTIALAATIALTISALWIALGKNTTSTQVNSPINGAEIIPDPPGRMVQMEFPSPIRTLHVALGGDGNGSSWEHPLGNLHQALAMAGPGIEIRLAAGIYRPSNTGDRNATFTVPSGTRLRGSFSTQTGLQNRHQHPSILNGDLQKNDNENTHCQEPSRLDNSIHLIVIAPGPDPTLIEGFEFTGANAESPALHNHFNLGIGAGLLIKKSKIVLNECRFTRLSGHSSSAIFDFGKSHIQVNRCEFIDNQSLRSGIFHLGLMTTYSFSQCLFSDNHCLDSPQGYQWAGALFAATGTRGQIERTVFANNSAVEAGGGIFNQGSMNLISCTFFENLSADGLAIKNYNTGALKIWNSIFINQTGGTNFIGNVGKCNLWNVHVGNQSNLFFEHSNILGKDQIIFTLDDGLRLNSTYAQDLYSLGAYSN